MSVYNEYKLSVNISTIDTKGKITLYVSLRKLSLSVIKTTRCSTQESKIIYEISYTSTLRVLCERTKRIILSNRRANY